jgi:N-acyl-D-aspartate/D-glutamate deacylase
MPAQRLGFKNRGLIMEGMCADITIFNPDTVEDKATVANPRQYPVGIDYVLVNGEIVVRNGRFNGTIAGKVLHK